MIASALATALAAAALQGPAPTATPPATTWLPVGISASRLRVFLDRESVHDVGGLRHVRVRIGSPTAITGRIVLVYQRQQIDCAGQRWRMTGFEGVDEDGKVIDRSPPDAPPRPFLPAVAGTIGGEVARTACALSLTPAP